MILKFQCIDADVKRFVGLLCDTFDRAVWIVFQPSYIDLGSDGAYHSRVVQMNSGEAAFRIASTELRTLIEGDLIGFDWTDLEALELDGNRRLVYLQCVDAILWYAKPYDVHADKVLRESGFEEVDLDDLPYAEQKIG